MTKMYINRTVVEQALEAFRMCVPMDGRHAEVDAAFRNLRAALHQQEEQEEPVTHVVVTHYHADGVPPQEPVQEPRKFDHGIGADRFKVVRGPAYTWCVLIGDSPNKHGKFYTQASAEEMAALLRREFRNGAFVQHEASAALAQQAEPLINQCGETCERAKLCAVCARALAEPVEPVAWVKEDVCDGQYIDGRPRKIWWECNKGVGTAFYTTPPQRLPLTEEVAALTAQRDALLQALKEAEPFLAWPPLPYQALDARKRVRLAIKMVGV